MADDMPDTRLVSDDERESVCGTLRTAFSDGRLTSDEHEARVAVALGARTLTQLRLALAGLVPAAELVRSAPMPQRTGTPATAQRRAYGVAMLLPLLLGVAGLLMGGPNGRPLIFLSVTCLGMVGAVFCADAAGRKQLRDRGDAKRLVSPPETGAPLT